MTKQLVPATCYLRMSSDKQDTSIDDRRAETTHARCVRAGHFKKQKTPAIVPPIAGARDQAGAVHAYARHGKAGGLERIQCN